MHVGTPPNSPSSRSREFRLEGREKREGDIASKIVVLDYVS
jgi:hypothetical protein